jgi:hypothetical protein
MGFWDTVGNIATGVALGPAGYAYDAYQALGGADAFTGDADSAGILGQGKYRPDPNAALLPGPQGQPDGFAAWQKQMQAGAAAAAGRGAPQLGLGGPTSPRPPPRPPPGAGFAAPGVAAPGAAGPGLRPVPPPSGLDQFRDQQASLSGILFRQATGQGPSVAQGQLQSATDRNLSQAYALAQSAGASDPGALKHISDQRAAIGQQAAADSAQLRMQEQLGASNQLGQLLAGARGQDIGQASDNASLQVQQNAQNDAMVRFYLGQGMTLAQAQQQANLTLQGIKMNAFNMNSQNAQTLPKALGPAIIGAAL